MLTLGIDIGTGTSKAVILEDGEKLVASHLITNKGRPTDLAHQIYDSLTESSGIEMDEIDYIASTGYGRYQVEERKIQITDLTTTGRGANFIYDSPTIILDIGNQSSRALRVDERGKILQFKVNERCAAGSGRFIDRCSKYLTVPQEKVSEIAMRADKPQEISSVCAVLSETEIINHVSLGVSVENIFMGVLLSIADRATTLLKRVKLDADVYLTGGLVHLEAMKHALSKVIDYKIHSDPLAHYAAAIGAAKLGYQRAQKIAQTI